MEPGHDIFEISDEELYEEICHHPKSLQIQSTLNVDGDKKQFRYVYADDPKFMLGQGSFGRVLVCFYEGDSFNIKLALKIIKIPQEYQKITTIERIVETSRQQILALIKLRQNKHIIQIQDIIRNNNQIFIMLEFCNEKSLDYYLHKLKVKGQITREFDVRYHFHQILDAFKSLHQQNFMHRDIKPSNILVHNGVLKVADFGLARQVFQQQRESFQEPVGTMITAAPQIVFKEEYTNKCDIYSLGVILYWMIYDRFPFERPPTKQDFLNNTLSFPECKYFPVSEEMKKVLKQMLAYQEENRIDWVQLLTHDLFNSPMFGREEKKIKNQYENLQIEKLRKTYGRNVVYQVLNDDLFLESALPTSYYRFVQENYGDQENQKNSVENPSLHAHKMIKEEYRNQHIRIIFYRMLVLELEGLDLDIKKSKKQPLLIRNLLLFCIQKYMLHRMIMIKDQLLNIIPHTIFKTQNIKQASQFPLHKNFIDTIVEKVKGSQFLLNNNFSKEYLKKLKEECQNCQIYNEISAIFQEINQINQQMFLLHTDQLILEMVCFLKPQIIKMSKQGRQNKNLYVNTILCVHHLFMFSNQNLIFPERHKPGFPYGNFLDREQYRVEKNFKILNEKVLELLSRFQ